MYKYDIVEYNHMYFVRRRLFGRFSEQFYRPLHSYWVTKVRLIQLMGLGLIRPPVGRLGNAYHGSYGVDLDTVTDAYERLSGISDTKSKAKAKAAEFKVYGS